MFHLFVDSSLEIVVGHRTSPHVVKLWLNHMVMGSECLKMMHSLPAIRNATRDKGFTTLRMACTYGQ
jgi:hypothetical protein